MRRESLGLGGPRERFSGGCCVMTGAAVKLGEEDGGGFHRRLFPPRNSASLPVGLPAMPPDLTGLPRSAPARPGRGWVPSIPRRQRCPPGQTAVPGQRLPPISGRSLSSRDASHHREVQLTRHHRGFTRIHPSGLPQPVATGWNGGPWAFPWAPHRAVTGPARQGGDRSRALTWDHPSGILPLSFQVTHSTDATSCRTGRR